MYSPKSQCVITLYGDCSNSFNYLSYTEGVPIRRVRISFSFTHSSYTFCQILAPHESRNRDKG